MQNNNSKFKILRLWRKNSKFQRKTCGFSLIELMVTTSIIAIISSIILFNFPSFASKILLENLTHEIALVVRQAQVYGIGIKQTSSGLFPAYGAHFDITSADSKKRVVFFADIDGGGDFDFAIPGDDSNSNGFPDAGEGEALEVFSIQRGNTVSALCYDVSCVPANTIDVTFKRPEPEAHIRVNGGGAEVSSAKISVTSPNAEIGDRYIIVYSSGQIAVTAD